MKKTLFCATKVGYESRDVIGTATFYEADVARRDRRALHESPEKHGRAKGERVKTANHTAVDSTFYLAFRLESIP